MKKGKKILIVVATVLVVLGGAQIIVLGAFGGIGPFKFIRDQRIASKPGNASQYHPENISPLVNSPIAGKKLLFLGSSVTQGTASLGVSMADYIAALDGCSVTKEAVSGTTLAGMEESTYVSRLLKVDPSQDFDAVICQLSTNDATQEKAIGAVSDSFELDGLDRTTVIGAMEYIIVYVKQTWNCPVIFYTGTKYDSERYATMVDAVLELGTKWDIGIIDLWNDPDMNAVSAEDYALYMSDPIHPTQAGYLKWWIPKFEAYLYDCIGD